MEEEEEEICKTPLTNTVIVVCIVAGSSGVLYGYDTTVSGVMMMTPFLEKFFPAVLAKMRDPKEDQYCLFDNHKLTAFIASMFIAGLMSSLLAGRVTRVIGRRFSLITSGILFITGNAFAVFADNVTTLLVGRLFVGFGIGFANQAAPVYITEMAPSKWRGALNTAFQFFVCLGAVIASLINLAANHSKSSHGWRLSLGCASVPATVLIIGALFIPDTPSSLIQRGKSDEALAALTKVRSTREGAEAELNDLINCNEAVRSNHEWHYKTLMQPRFRPHLVLTLLIAGFQQLTGIGMIAFYAPVVLRTIGLRTEGSLCGTLVIGVVNLASVFMSTCMVDNVGRRLMFLQGGLQIIFGHVFIACTLAIQSQGQYDELEDSYWIAVLVLMCLISSAFGWSWGPLTWLIPSEILPIEVRAAGTGIGVSTNFIMTFILTQCSMSMLCSMKYGLFFFYGAMTSLMTAVIGVFLPETKGVPLEFMDTVWCKHWYWKYVVTAQV
ncbi:putative sugar transport protein STP/MST-like, plant [Helianthus annuus]|nr:putative sugar transport protein STP/MST-like, plant [Helianthus annuus]